jgi:hypothetical protein
MALSAPQARPGGGERRTVPFTKNQRLPEAAAITAARTLSVIGWFGRRGTSRGTTLRSTVCILRIPSTRVDTQSQAERSARPASPLIIRRSWVRSPAAPPSLTCEDTFVRGHAFGRVVESINPLVLCSSATAFTGAVTFRDCTRRRVNTTRGRIRAGASVKWSA